MEKGIQNHSIGKYQVQGLILQPYRHKRLRYFPSMVNISQFLGQEAWGNMDRNTQEDTVDPVQFPVRVGSAIDKSLYKTPENYGHPDL